MFLFVGIFYLIPLTVFIFWLVAFLTESSQSLLTLSILLILFTLPHTILMTLNLSQFVATQKRVK